MKGSAIFTAVLLLSACVEAPASPAASAEAGCSAESLQHLVGRPESAFDASDFDEPVRVVHPGEAVTMDFNPERLNVEIDANGMIAAIRCG